MKNSSPLRGIESIIVSIYATNSSQRRCFLHRLNFDLKTQERVLIHPFWEGSNSVCYFNKLCGLKNDNAIKYGLCGMLSM
jgi:hypothetical protein